MGQLIRSTSYPSLLGEIHDEIDRLFEPDLMKVANKQLYGTDQWIPACDLKELDDCYMLWLDVPGMKPEDIEISVENNVLMIKGSKEIKKDIKEENYLCKERFAGSFVRNFALPSAVNSSKITAKDLQGVLEIYIPKNSKGKSHKIEIMEK